jgi:hypothetical protein
MKMLNRLASLRLHIYMRMTFRQFLMEAAPNVLSQGKPILTGNLANRGGLEFPDLTYLNDPGQAPPGGHQSFQSIVQTNIDRQFYYTNQMLQILSVLANNIYSDWQSRVSGVTTQNQSYYPNAVYDQSRNVITGIAPEEIVGYGHRRLQPQQMQLATQMNILQQDSSNANALLLDINTLRQQMLEAREKMKNSKYSMYRAGKADQALSAMTSPGMVQLSKSANPYQ